MESPFLNVPGVLKYIGLLFSGVCHQLPGHSLFFGAQFPLCARCTGMYLGIALGVANLAARRRWRSPRLASAGILALQGLFFLAWAADGVNSYLDFLGFRTLYSPSNWLRLTTGALNGLSLSLLIVPLFSFTAWDGFNRERVVRDWREFGALLVQAGAFVVLLLSGFTALMTPLLAIALAGVVGALSLINGMLVIIALHRENLLSTWGKACRPLLLGMVLGLLEMLSLAALRLLWVRLAPWPA